MAVLRFCLHVQQPAELEESPQKEKVVGALKTMRERMQGMKRQKRTSIEKDGAELALSDRDGEAAATTGLSSMKRTVDAPQLNQ
jgi:hypothetical protein